MSDNRIETEIQAKGLTAPRVTPADIEANIAREQYFTAANGVLGAMIDDNIPMFEDDQHPDSVLRRIVYCILTLNNGFTTTGFSIYTPKDSFDPKRGRSVAKSRAIKSVISAMDFSNKMPEQSKTEDEVAAKKSMSSTRKKAVQGLQHYCHKASLGAGWWTDLSTGEDLREQIKAGTLLGKALVAQKLMLIVSEVGEAMEGHRKGLPDDKLPHRPMIEVELADALIRIADLAGAMGLDLAGAVAEKLDFNASRHDHKIESRQAEGGKAY